MPDTDSYTYTFAPLNIDTLAFALAIELITDQANHSEFDIENNNDFDSLATAIAEDLADLVHNGNQDDWLIYFYDHEKGPIPQELLDRLAYMLGENDTNHDRYFKFINDLAERIATIIFTQRNGVPGYVMMFPPTPTT
jgi:hypothetical protein